MELLERFLNYTKVRTTSDEANEGTTPSTARQFDLAKILVKELKVLGVKPQIIPVRGGTDGAALSFMGLPCPNLGTGGWCFHGPLEHISLEAMEKVVSILENLVEIYAEG